MLNFSLAPMTGWLADWHIHLSPQLHPCFCTLWPGEVAPPQQFADSERAALGFGPRRIAVVTGHHGISNDLGRLVFAEVFYQCGESAVLPQILNVDLVAAIVKNNFHL